MANIKQYLDNILGAILGKDVRKSIHDGIEKINNEVEAYRNLTNDTKKRQDMLEEKYENQIKNIAGGEYQNAEIVDARNGFDTLRKYHKTENVSF